MASVVATSSVARTAISSVAQATVAQTQTNSSNKQTTGSGTSTDGSSSEIGKGLTKLLDFTDPKNPVAKAAQTAQQVASALGPYASAAFASPAAAMLPPGMAQAAQAAAQGIGAMGGAFGGGGGGSSGGAAPTRRNSSGGNSSENESGGGCGPGGCRPPRDTGGSSTPPTNFGGRGDRHIPPTDSRNGVTGQGLDPKTNQGAADLNNVMQGASDKPLLVKFGAQWCPPCRGFDSQNGITKGGQTTKIPGATLHDKGQYSILKVDVDQNQTLSQQLGVNANSIPAFGYAYRKQDGSIGIAQSIDEAKSGHTKVADVKIHDSKPTTTTPQETKTKEPTLSNYKANIPDSMSDAFMEAQICKGTSCTKIATMGFKDLEKATGLNDQSTSFFVHTKNDGEYSSSTISAKPIDEADVEHKFSDTNLEGRNANKIDNWGDFKQYLQDQKPVKPEPEKKPDESS